MNEGIPALTLGRTPIQVSNLSNWQEIALRQSINQNLIQSGVLFSCLFLFLFCDRPPMERCPLKRKAWINGGLPPSSTSGNWCGKVVPNEKVTNSDAKRTITFLTMAMNEIDASLGEDLEMPGPEVNFSAGEIFTMENDLDFGIPDWFWGWDERIKIYWVFLSQTPTKLATIAYQSISTALVVRD